MSRKTLFSDLIAGAGSARRIRQRNAAETKYDTASMANAPGAPTNRTTVPANDGPTTWAPDAEASRRLFASTSLSFSTNTGTYARYAVSKMTVPQATTNAMAISNSIFKNPN